MKRSSIQVMPDYYDRYINLIEDVDVVEALEKYGIPYFALEKEKLKELGDKIYAPGKWTVKNILQHIIDTERVFAYRALRFARKDKTPLPGFDENAYADKALAGKRNLDDLIKEFCQVRSSSISLFKSLNEEQLMSEGICSDKTCSVLAIGFMITGHAVHHLNVIKERYYPLI